MWERRLWERRLWERLILWERRLAASLQIRIKTPIFCDDRARSSSQNASMALTKGHSRNLRKGRFSRPGQFYFLTTSVHGRHAIFLQESHARVVLDAILWQHSAGRFLLDAAVLMPDHLHLVGQLGHISLDKVMHSLKSFSAHKLVNAGIGPPIWQDGYHDHGLRNDESYMAKLHYVLQNPIRAGLARRVEEYPYVILPDWWVSRSESMDAD